MKTTRIIFLVVDLILIIAVFNVFLVKDKKVIAMEEKQKIIADSDKPVVLKSIDNNMYKETEEHRFSDDEFEEKIINIDKNQKKFKLIDTTVDGYVMHILVVYDPSIIRLMVGNGFNTPNNAGLERISEMTARYGAVAGVNGGGFLDNGTVQKDIPDGYVIKDGTILYGDTTRVGRLIGFNKDNRLTLLNTTGDEAIAQGMRDAVEFGAFLIVDGEITQDAKRLGEMRASRVIVSQRKDGIVMFAVTDGGANVGAKLIEIVNTLKSFGAYNAANLDGGASSQLVINGNLINTTRWAGGGIITTGRKVLNGWGLFVD